MQEGCVEEASVRTPLEFVPPHQAPNGHIGNPEVIGPKSRPNGVGYLGVTDQHIQNHEPPSAK